MRPEITCVDPAKLSEISVVFVLESRVSLPGIVAYSSTEKHHAEGEDVSILTLVLDPVDRDLRSHVHGSSDGSAHEAARRGALQFLTKIEVDNLEFRLFCYHHVIQLDVSMSDSGLVDLVNRTCYLGENISEELLVLHTHLVDELKDL